MAYGLGGALRRIFDKRREVLVSRAFLGDTRRASKLAARDFMGMWIGIHSLVIISCKDNKP